MYGSQKKIKFSEKGFIFNLGYFQHILHEKSTGLLEMTVLTGNEDSIFCHK